MGGIWISVVIAQWVVIALLCLVVVGILRYLAVFRERMDLAAPPTTTYSIGDSVPDLEFEKITTGEPFKPANGGPYLAAFLSSTCSGCREVLTQLDQLFARGLHNPDIEIDIVFVDEAPAAFLSSWPNLQDGTSLNILRDPRAVVPEVLGVWALPTAILVDKRGRVEDQTTNPHIANWLYKALNEGPPPSEAAEPRLVPYSVPRWTNESRTEGYPG